MTWWEWLLLFISQVILIIWLYVINAWINSLQKEIEDVYNFFHKEGKLDRDHNWELLKKVRTGTIERELMLAYKIKNLEQEIYDLKQNIQIDKDKRKHAQIL